MSNGFTILKTIKNTSLSFSLPRVKEESLQQTRCLKKINLILLSRGKKAVSESIS